MSFTILSTANPQIGEEQPLSSSVNLVDSWTTLDISAAFLDGKTPYNVIALIIIGADLPRAEHLVDSGMLGRLYVRKFGDSTPPEEALVAIRYNLTNETSVIYRNGEEYKSGGFLTSLSIPVDADGKFEYQLQNDSVAPRTIIKLLKVITIEEIPYPVPITEKGVANGVACLNGSTLVVENPANATAIPVASKIPIADESGLLNGWVTAGIPTAEKGTANGVASLNSSTLVVENPENATAIPASNKIPISDESGLLDGWVTAGIPTAEKGAANGVASLNGSTLVVEDPANATATPTADKIPKADGAGKLDGWVTIPSVPPAFEVIDVLTVPVSHTGDLINTVIYKVVVPANKMGPNGAVRISSIWQTTVGTSAQWWIRIYFGGTNIAGEATTVNRAIDSRPIAIWNKNDAGAQRYMQENMLMKGHFGNSVIRNLAVDTTQDVDIEFKAQCGHINHVVYLHYASVEVLHQD